MLVFKRVSQRYAAHLWIIQLTKVSKQTQVNAVAETKEQSYLFLYDRF
jgi:hypothetical protein